MAKKKSKPTLNNEAEKELEAAEQAIQKNPNDASNWRRKGIILAYFKRYDEALEAINKAIELNPEDDDNWRWKSSYLSDLKRYDEAL